jgi:hypothetical protein
MRPNFLCLSHVTGFPEFQRLEKDQWADSTDVHGYIQMEASVFYHLLSDDSSRLNWYTNFAASREAVLT